MPVWVRAWGDGLRRGWEAAGRPTGREVAGALLVLAGAVALVQWGGPLGAGWQASLGCGLVLALAVVLHRVWARLFGPVLFYDLVRSVRRDRYFLLRCAYGALLLVILSWVHWSWFASRGDAPVWFEEGTMQAREMSRFAASFFATFLAVQFSVVVLLTPIYTASAIAEEKENRTLEFLLATDLSSREIVLSKLASRLTVLGLLVLTGLPVLALTQLWGGVDPALVAAGFAATAVTMLSLGSLGLLNSVFAKTSLQAMIRTYAQAGAFLLFGWCVPGHPVWAWNALGAVWNRDTNQTQAVELIALVGVYGFIHLVITGACLWAALGYLRRVALAQPMVAVRRKRSPWPDQHVVPPVPPPPPRPRVEDHALLWKELYAEPGLRWERLHPVLAVLLLFLGVTAASVGLTLALVGLAAANGSVGEPVNWWVRIVGTPLACGLLLVMAFRAAGSVSRERERQTLDSLLTVPDGREAVLSAKWLGSLLCVRQAWWCLAVVWGFGVFTGGLHLLALPLVLVAFLVSAGFVCSLGVYFSTVSRTTLRATLLTGVTLLALGLGPWLLATGAAVLLEPWLGPGLAGYADAFLRYGLALPMPLVMLAFRFDGFVLQQRDPVAAEVVVGCLAGLVCYAAAAAVLWRLAVAHLRAEKGKPLAA